MINKKIYNVFRKGSRTYFISSLFFPSEIKKDVFSLYAFVRTADDFIDQVPQNKKAFLALKDSYHKALEGKLSGDVVVDSFVQVKKKHKIGDTWMEAFFDSMNQDLSKTKYKNTKELAAYMYGSAEVIGLMMAKILDLDKKAYKNAQYLGRAMQFANFIRDISHDLSLGRVYMPQDLLKKHSIKKLSQKSSERSKKDFEDFIWEQCDLYDKWQVEAEKGFKYIPKRVLIPIKTASDMYKWTVEQIRENPMAIYDGQIRPSTPRVIMQVVKNTLQIGLIGA